MGQEDNLIFQVYLTNTGCQVTSMAQFVQTHGGGRALLYKDYKYLKLPDGKEWPGKSDYL